MTNDNQFPRGGRKAVACEQSRHRACMIEDSIPLVEEILDGRKTEIGGDGAVLGKP